MRRTGMPVFDLLRTGQRAKTDVALFAFDLLELNGEDLRREPIEARKARLMKLLSHSDPNVRHPGRARVNRAPTRRLAPFNS
jgi:bifunctional non-homologous end joining protein LigD